MNKAVLMAFSTLPCFGMDILQLPPRFRRTEPLEIVKLPPLEQLNSHFSFPLAKPGVITGDTAPTCAIPLHRFTVQSRDKMRWPTTRVPRFDAMSHRSMPVCEHREAEK